MNPTLDRRGLAVRLNGGGEATSIRRGDDDDDDDDDDDGGGGGGTGADDGGGRGGDDAGFVFVVLSARASKRAHAYIRPRWTATSPVRIGFH